MKNDQKLIFLLAFILFSSFLFSYQLDYDLMDECSYFENSGFIMNPLYLEKPSQKILEQHTFIESTQLICTVNYDENELIIIRDVTSDSDIINIFNKGLEKLYTYTFEKNIKFSFKQNNFIKFNPTKNRNSKNEIVLKIYSKSINEILFTRMDVRSGTLNIENKSYFIALTTNSFRFKKDENNCFYYIDKNNNGKNDFNNTFDENGNNTSEKYNIDDSFTLNGKVYQISSISSDGFQIEIEEIKNNIKIAKGFSMPNFDYDSGGKIKKFSNNNNEVTFIFWWKPNCPGSVAGIPAINRIWSKFNNMEGFKLISLTSLDNDSFKVASENMFLPSGEKIAAIFPTETQNDLLKPLFGLVVPKVIIVDKNGIIKLVSACSLIIGNYDESKDENLKKYDYYVSELLKY